MKKLLPQTYELIADEALFAIVVWDDQNNCIYANKMASEMFGSDQIQLRDLCPSQEHSHFKIFSIDLLRHDGFYQDILVNKPDQSSFVANLGIRTIDIGGSPARMITFQNITLQKKLQREIMAKQNEIKSAYEELLKQNQQLKELDIAKDRFIALTTHELRTPLSAMVASAEILKLGLYDNNEQMIEFINMIYDQGLHLQDLVNDILDFAKIQAGKMDFYLELQDVTSLVKSVMHNFQGMAETNQITMMVIGDLPHNCYFDEVRLRQVLSNMINNAIKYNRTGGTVAIEFTQDEELVRIFVRDTGKGIPREQFDNVFNEFETIGQVAQHHKGTGLGMPISRKLTEGMGGKLLLDSEVGIGSVFWLELPKKMILDESLYRPRPTDGNLVA